MEVMYARCAGLDVHAATVVACVRIATGPAVTYEHRTVPTTSRGLLELADWLAGTGVPMSPWKPPACSGSRSGMSSRGPSRWCSPTRCTSATSRAVRAT